jgi:nucleoside-diphosphate-sugar epimerase
MANNNALHVIFGTGPVGMSIMETLRRRDIPVRMVNRSGKIHESLPAGVEVVAGDASDKAFAVQAAKGAAVVYNALNPAYSQWVQLFPSLQAGAVEAAAANGARLVVMDNLYMYGDPDGQPIHEGMPYAATNKKGTLRAKMARDLMAEHTAGRVQVAVGRASDFFGPRVLGSAMGEVIFGNAVAGKAAQFIGTAKHPHSYSYMPDIGRALVELALADDAYGQVWHIPSPKAVTTQQMVEKIYAAVGAPVKLQIAPPFLISIVGLFNPDLGEMVEMGYEFEKPFIIDSSKFEKRFGWSATPLDVAIGETVAWYKQHMAALPA